MLQQLQVLFRMSNYTNAYIQFENLGGEKSVICSINMHRDGLRGVKDVHWFI